MLAPEAPGKVSSSSLGSISTKVPKLFERGWEATVAIKPDSPRNFSEGTMCGMPFMRPESSPRAFNLNL